MNDYTFKIEDLVFDSLEDAKRICFVNMCKAMCAGDSKKSKYWYNHYSSIKEM